MSDFDGTIIRRGRRIRIGVGSPISRLALLTPRQREIIACRCERDMTNDEIGYMLKLNGSTIKNHVTTILTKMNSISMHSVCVTWGRYLERQDHIELPDHAIRSGDV
jgi:DNA-binding CsgD family transcriptional regulator